MKRFRVRPVGGRRRWRGHLPVANLAARYFLSKKRIARFWADVSFSAIIFIVCRTELKKIMT